MRTDDRRGLLVVVTGVFILSLDVTMLDIVLPEIAADLSADQTQISWIADCYNVALAGLILLAAGLGGRFGQRRMFLTGLGVFGLGSLATGLASTPAVLIASRSLMGVGAACLATSAVALTGIMFPGERRARALATWAAASGIGLAIGPIVGGMILTVADWRWIFFFLIPVVIAMLPLGREWLPRGLTPEHPRLDIPGAALSALALVPLIAALLQVPDLGWSDARVLGGVALGIALLVLFALRELRASAPMIDIRVLRIPGVGGASLALAASYVGFLGLQFLGAVQLRTSFSLTPVEAGLVLAPWAIAFWIGARVGFVLVSRYRAGSVVIAGLVIMGSSFAVLAALSPLGPLWIGIGLFLAGIGGGFVTPVSVNLMLSLTPQALLSTSSGLSMVVRYGGGAVGLAVCASAAALTNGDPGGYLAGGVLVVVLGTGATILLRRQEARLAPPR